MSNGDKVMYLALFMGLPFVIAAAFKFTDWLGWPTLLILGWMWIGVAMTICQDKK